MGSGNRGIHTGPLHPVQGPFRERGEARCFIGGDVGIGLAAGNFPHSAAKADGIGGNHVMPVEVASGGNGVVQFYITLVIGIKGEGTQVNPGPAAFLLVDDEGLLSAQVMDGIVGRRCAVRRGFIGNIDGIFAAFGNDGGPSGRGGCFAFALAGCLAGRSHRKGVFVQDIERLHIGKALSGILPTTGLGIGTAAAQQAFPRLVKSRVVIGYTFVHLRIPLAGRHDIGAGIFQHGHQEGNHVALGVQIFYRPQNRGALPLPTGSFLLVIPAMALPESNVSPGKAFAENHAAFFLYEGMLGRPVVGFPLNLYHQVLQRHVLAQNASHGVSLIRIREPGSQLGAEPVQVFGPPGIVGQFTGETEIQDIVPLPRDLFYLDAAHDGGALLEARLQRIAGGVEFAGTLGGKDCACQQQKAGNKISHFCLEMSSIKTKREQMAMARASAKKSRESADRYPV